MAFLHAKVHRRWNREPRCRTYWCMTLLWGFRGTCREEFRPWLLPFVPCFPFVLRTRSLLAWEGCLFSWCLRVWDLYEWFLPLQESKIRCKFVVTFKLLLFRSFGTLFWYLWWDHHRITPEWYSSFWKIPSRRGTWRCFRSVIFEEFIFRSWEQPSGNRHDRYVISVEF